MLMHSLLENGNIEKKLKKNAETFPQEPRQEMGLESVKDRNQFLVTLDFTLILKMSKDEY